MQKVDFDKVSSRSDVEKIISEHLSDKRLNQFILKNLYRVNEGRFNWRLNLEAINDNLEFVSGSIDMHSTYDNPSLFIKGGLSDYIGNKDLELIQKYFPAATFRTIPGATHWVHADKPDDLCALLSDFLEKECEYN